MMMRRSIVAAAVFAVTLMGSIPATATAEPIDYSKVSKMTVPGDVNADGSFQVNDLVQMYRYLHGQSDMALQGFHNTDLNEDGCTDVIDMTLMKRRLLNDPVGFTAQMDLVPYTSEFWRKAEGENRSEVIRSTSDLEKYFEPVEVFTTTGAFAYYYMLPTDIVMDYLKKYDDAFFAENVLCLNVINQSCGGDLMYKITGFTRDKYAQLHIHYTDTYDPMMPYPDVVNGVLAQVIIPRELDRLEYGTHGDFPCTVYWDYEEQTYQVEEFKPTVTSDLTAAVTESAWDAALSGTGTAVITSPEELEAYASRNFRNAVVRSLKSIYDAAFFEENVLIVDLNPQLWNDDWESSLKDVEKTEEGIVLNYDRLYINGYARNYALLFTQVTLSKSQYNGEAVIVNNPWEKTVSASFSSYDIDSLSMASGNQESLTNDFSKSPAWVTSYEEMEAYLNECFTEAGMEAIGNFILSDAKERFADKAAYIEMDTDIIGSSHRMKRAYLSDGRLVLNMTNSQPLSCFGGSFLNILWTDKEHAGLNVSKRSLNNYVDDVSGDGDIIFIDFQGDYWNYAALAVNQYTVHDEAQIDFYWVPWGGGPVMYNTPRFAGTMAVPAGCTPFSQDSTFDDGKTNGDSFSITWGEDSAFVTFDLPDGSSAQIELAYSVPAGCTPFDNGKTNGDSF